MRDTLESKRKSRTDAVLPTDNREQPRSQGPLLRQREDPGNKVDPWSLCLLQFVARLLYFCAKNVSTNQRDSWMPVLATLLEQPFLRSNLGFHFRKGGGDPWGEFLRVVLQGRTCVIVCVMASGIAGKTLPCNSQRAFVVSQEIYQVCNFCLSRRPL